MENPKTPTRQTFSATALGSEDTPRDYRSDGGIYNQADLRPLIAVEMKNEIVTCPVQSFIEHYLPFQPTAADVEKGRSALVDNGHITPEGEWIKLRRPPSQVPNAAKDGLIKPREEHIFEPLIQIWETLSAVPPTGKRTPHFRYYSRPNHTMHAETAGANHKIDGYFHKCKGRSATTGDDSVAASDVAVVAEFKLSNADVKANREQLVGAANHIMNDDPRRLFTYGITIEKTDVSLWYFSRSHSVKSHKFDLTEELNTFIRVFLSFTFATETAMGFDPTITRVLTPDPQPKDGKPSGKASKVMVSDTISYIFTLEGVDKKGRAYKRYFKTHKTIFDLRRLCITGRATRVWEAQEVVSPVHNTPLRNAPIVVLRDVWLDEGAKTELKIQDELFEGIEAFATRAGNECPEFSDFDSGMKDDVQRALKDAAYKNYFLTIACDSEGPVSKSVAEDHQRGEDIFMINAALPQSSSGTSRSSSSAASHVSEVSLQRPRATAPSERPKRTYKAKRPYRLVYEERCQSLDNTFEGPLSDTFTVLRDCLIALTLMYCAGWVHRDVSCGNVLLFMDDEGKVTGKLSDLEYAKKFPTDNASSDPKTGTAYFMPVEIALRRLLAFQDGPRVRRGPIQHHFQHDLESLWWLSLWIITTRMGHLPSLASVSAVFAPASEVVAHARFHVIDQQQDIEDIIEQFHPALQFLGEPIRECRQKLAASYRQLNTVPYVTSSLYSRAYTHMRSFLYTPIPIDAPALVKRERAVGIQSKGKRKAEAELEQAIDTVGSNPHERSTIKRMKPRRPGADKATSYRSPLRQD